VTVSSRGRVDLDLPQPSLIRIRVCRIRFRNAQSYTVPAMAQRPAYRGHSTVIASLRITQGLLAEIDAEAKARRVSRTSLLREVLRLGWAAYRDAPR